MTDQVSPEGGASPITSGAGPASGASPVSSSTTPAQTTAGTPTETKAESPPAVETPKEPKGFMKRIDELTRLRRDAERARDQAQKNNERLLALLEQRGHTPQQSPQTPQAQQQGPKAPTEDDLLKRAEALLEARQRRSRFDERAAKFAATVEDYHEVTDPGDDPDNARWACSEAMGELIEDSEEGPALVYHLAQNPDVAAKLARMSPALAGRELTKLENQLVTERAKAAVKPVSQAPPPPPKIEGSDPGNVERDPTKMTQKQFNKWRESFRGKRP